MATAVGLDFKEIKERVDLRDLLRAEGIAIPDRATFSIRCPFPEHEDSTPSCKIRPNGFHCYGCGRKGSVLDYVMLRYNYSTLADAAEHIVQDRPFLAQAPKLPSTPPIPHPNDTSVDEKLERILGFFSQRLGDPEPAAYLAARGIKNLRALRTAGVGFSSRFHRIVFPTYHYRDGIRVALNFCGRAILADDPLRYRQSSTLRPTTAFMVGTTPLISPERMGIVEGQIDALSIADVGVPAMASAGAGRVESLKLTLEIYPEFRPGRFIIVADNQMKALKPGMEAVGDRFALQVEELVKKLRPGTPCICLHPPYPHKDANDWLIADRAGFAAALVRA